MRSVTTLKFKKAYEKLPKAIREKAYNAYQIWRSDPNHPSIQFKRIKTSKNTYSVRIDLEYRALGARLNNTIIWFWIGSHDDYLTMIRNM